MSFGKNSNNKLNIKNNFSFGHPVAVLDILIVFTYYVVHLTYLKIREKKFIKYEKVVKYLPFRIRNRAITIT